VCFIFYKKQCRDWRRLENGETEYDIFIGADGSNSKVRESLIWKSQFYSGST
jgi:2-polyprenyl-6-methoxyphenol hydroxylase-like FAD-dependent oxidoreductase